MTKRLMECPLPHGDSVCQDCRFKDKTKNFDSPAKHNQTHLISGDGKQEQFNEDFYRDKYPITGKQIFDFEWKPKDKHDCLGDRMKEQYENRTRYFLPRRTYTVIRLDGKAFHTFTKGMERPYDKMFVQAMDQAAKRTMEEIQGAKAVYVQSDEVSILMTDFDKTTTDAWFNGNIQKIASVAASIMTAHFNRLLPKDTPAYFDARVFTIPDPVEVQNYFIWRQNDCIRNSISMLAQAHFSHKELQGVSQRKALEMLAEKDVYWDKMTNCYKMGRLYDKTVGIMQAAPNFKEKRIKGLEF